MPTIVAQFVLGMRSTVASEVTDWRDSGESRRAVFAAAWGPVRARGVHTFVALSSGTRYTWAMEWDELLGPWGRALNWLMRCVWSGKPRPPLDNLKRLL